MIKPIYESLYRWKKDGWDVLKLDNDQITLVHPRARPVVCGLRTSFQTVGAVQGEMQRALRDGAKPALPAAPPVETVMPRRAKTKKKPSTGRSVEAPIGDPFGSRPAVPYRRPPAAIVEAPPRRPLAFENAAWELAYLLLKTQNVDPHVITIMERRYQTDEQYRTQLIQSFRDTPQAKIQALRDQVARQAASAETAG